MTETTILVRLGRTLYWIGSALAGVSILVGVTVAVMFLIFEGSRNSLDALLSAGGSILVGLVLAVLAWLVGKAARYILANEWTASKPRQMAGPAASGIVDKGFKAEATSQTDAGDPVSAKAIIPIQRKAHVGRRIWIKLIGSDLRMSRASFAKRILVFFFIYCVVMLIIISGYAIFLVMDGDVPFALQALIIVTSVIAMLFNALIGIAYWFCVVRRLRDIGVSAWFALAIFATSLICGGLASWSGSHAVMALAIIVPILVLVLFPGEPSADGHSPVRSPPR